MPRRGWRAWTCPGEPLRAHPLTGNLYGGRTATVRPVLRAMSDARCVAGLAEHEVRAQLSRRNGYGRWLADGRTEEMRGKASVKR